MYYNEEIKNKYLQEVACTANIKSVFSKIAPLEEEFGTDFGNINVESIARFISDNFELLNISVARNVVIRINAYRAWYSSANQRKLTFDDIDFVGIYKRHLYRSFNDVLSEMSSYDFQIGDEVGAAIALIWLGFKLSDTVMLKEEQVDWKNGLVFDSSGALMIREIEPSVLNVLSAYKSKTVGFRKRNHVEKVSKIETGFFLHRMDVKNTARDNAGKPIAYTNISQKILQISRDYQKATGSPSRLTASNIWYSGNFMRLYEYFSTHDFESDRSAKFKAKELLQNPQVSMSEAKIIYDNYKKAFDL